MTDIQHHPAYATAVEIAEHWSVDRRSVAAIAQRLRLARRATGYAWRAVWTAEGLAEPPPASWPVLRTPMLKAAGVAAQVGVSAKTVIRMSEEARDGFPAAVRLGPQIRRWRRDEIDAWLLGKTPPHRKTPASRMRLDAAARQEAAPAPVSREAAPVPMSHVAARPGPAATSAPSALFRPQRRAVGAFNDIAAAPNGIGGQTGGERTK